MKKLDKYHYHEALHTAFSLCEYIDLSLIQHHVYEGAPEDIKEHLSQAQEHLHEYYKWCCEKQDELE